MRRAPQRPESDDTMPDNSHHYAGNFRNPWAGSTPHGISGLVKWMLSRDRNGKGISAGEDFAALTVATDRQPMNERSEQLTVTWIGHSSFLLQCAGLNILTDPVWSDRVSPLSFIGPQRIVPPAVDFENLPAVDLTLISHDHYDHLDDVTVRRLIGRFPAMRWIAPLRVGPFLRQRGALDVTELDWWQHHQTLGISLGCTPAQHFSGRFPWNRNSTLWCGWTVTFENDVRVFFAGDTGLHPEFGEISSQFGPFDLAILPIGAYEPRWFMRPVHMSPEDSVKAFLDLTSQAAKPCIMVGSHWGTFRLTDEPVMEPPRLAKASWAQAGFDAELLWILSHGETRELNLR